MENIVDPLLKWYQINKRDLPWRDSNNPYYIWISEIMLQQTQVKTVIPYFQRFIQTLPDYQSLANVEDDKLMKLWEGLGYYSRARNLKVAANQIKENYKTFPQTYAQLLTLKGIGPYSAGAIASIAFNEKKPAVDGNVLRVISRVLNSEKDISLKSTFNYIFEEIEKILPVNSGDFNQALMELGATICTPKTYDCLACPIQKYCKANQTNNVAKLPIKTTKIKKKIENKTVIILTYQDEVAIVQNNEKILNNLWYFPMHDGHLSYDEVIQLYHCYDCYALADYTHIFTHLQWNMKGYVVKVDTKNEDYIWKNQLQIQNEVALPTAFKKYYEAFIEYESRSVYER